MKTRKWPKRTRNRDKREAQRHAARTGRVVNNKAELQAAQDAEATITAVTDSGPEFAIIFDDADQELDQAID